MLDDVWKYRWDPIQIIASANVKVKEDLTVAKYSFRQWEWVPKEEEGDYYYQAIEILPCTEFHIDSFNQMVKNHSAHYTATARLTVKAGDDIMDVNKLQRMFGRKRNLLKNWMSLPYNFRWRDNCLRDMGRRRLSLGKVIRLRAVYKILQRTTNEMS